jgi:hypothetical protein
MSFARQHREDQRLDNSNIGKSKRIYCIFAKVKFDVNPMSILYIR